MATGLITCLCAGVTVNAQQRPRNQGMQGQNAGMAQQQLSQFAQNVVKEQQENSQLERLAYQLLDSIGPRLVGTPAMQKAADWAIKTFNSWGITARTEKWGEWRSWERGSIQADLIEPRIHTLEAKQLAWSPGTGGKTVTGEVVILPLVTDSMAFINWLPQVKGKYILISAPQPTGRPDDNWKEYGTEASIEKMKKLQDSLTQDWTLRGRRHGLSAANLAIALENAGAAGILSSYWSKSFGSNKIFGANTKKVPHVDLSLEDYGLLYRLAQNGAKPKISLKVDAKTFAPAPAFNTIAEIKGVEKPDEYVILSAHFDSWDGGTGATDNGTGTLVMMEAARLLKKYYPNPKRTIIIGLWGSEEQGLNGSRAFVEDHPEIVKNTQAVFNQDNGTGRVETISGQGFLHAYDFMGRWLSKVPRNVTSGIETNYPGSPGGGGSDHASFVAAGVPAFMLSSLSWGYGTITWHTNRDTYDKIVFDDVKNNVILTAILAYEASEDPAKASREKIVLPVNPRTGQSGEWPAQRSPNRKGGLD